MISGTIRALRSGSFDNAANYLLTADRLIFDAAEESPYTGFRVAMIPEPSSLALGTFALSALAGLGWRRRTRLRGNATTDF